MPSRRRRRIEVFEFCSKSTRCLRGGGGGLKFLSFFLKAPDAFEEEEEEDWSFWVLFQKHPMPSRRRRRIEVFEFFSKSTASTHQSHCLFLYVSVWMSEEKNETYHYCSFGSIYCAPTVFQGCYLYRMWKSTDCQRIGADKRIQGYSVTTWPLDLGAVLKADFFLNFTYFISHAI